MHLSKILFDESLDIGQRVLYAFECVGLLEAGLYPLNYFLLVEVLFFLRIVFLPQLL